MTNKAKIKEIFSSIQGEGLYIGTKQLFIRFCACNLRCNYCDTPFLPVNINDKDTYFEFTPDELYEYIQKYDLDTINYISLTGGEPLIWTDFLSEFMPKVKTKFYLETNATITDNLYKVLSYIDIIAADIKLPSCSGVVNSFELHDKFFAT
ncbi:MAG: 7-carboxy-7-deazaguanine synthase QueE, partial [Candidatus Gastranaerophilaceae bacterium]